MPIERFLVSTSPEGPWFGPGEDGFTPWTDRSHFDTVEGAVELSRYLSLAGHTDPASDWYVKWPEEGVERLAYDGSSYGFIDGLPTEARLR